MDIKFLDFKFLTTFNVVFNIYFFNYLNLLNFIKKLVLIFNSINSKVSMTKLTKKINLKWYFFEENLMKKTLFKRFPLKNIWYIFLYL